MLWQRRHFIIGYATARNISMYTEAKLGQVWQVLTPLLNAGVYYLIFGLLFETARAVDHFPAFLLVGVFVFAFTERSIVTGSNVMRANLQLIRALYFPRASLPLAYVIVELQQMLIGMVVVVIAMLASEQWPSWYWLMLIPVVLLQTMFNTGAALIVARLGGAVADVSELIPFFLRISRYFCGVMYLVITVTYRLPALGAVGPVAQPVRGLHLPVPRRVHEFLPSGLGGQPAVQRGALQPVPLESRPFHPPGHQGADHADPSERASCRAL